MLKIALLGRDISNGWHLHSRREEYIMIGDEFGRCHTDAFCLWQTGYAYAGQGTGELLSADQWAGGILLGDGGFFCAPQRPGHSGGGGESAQ